MAVIYIIGGVLLVGIGAVLFVLGLGILDTVGILDMGIERGNRKALMFFGAVAFFGGMALIWKSRDTKELAHLEEKEDEIFLNILRMHLAGKPDKEMIDYCVGEGHEPEMAKLTVDIMVKKSASEQADKNLPAIIARLDEMQKSGQEQPAMVDYCTQQGLPEDLAKILAHGLTQAALTNRKF